MRRWLAFVTLLAGLGVALGYGALDVFNAPGPLGDAADIVIPHGGLDMVGAALKRAGAIGSVPIFEATAALTAWQGPLHAAELKFPEHASLAQILFILRAGHPVQHKVTFAEGLTAAEIAMVLARADGLTGEIRVPAEGSVLPETYLYERGTTAASVLKRAEAAMREAVDRAWATRSPDIALGKRDDLVTMASLVERETHLAVERPLVARVFYNRLAHGMRLQSDASVVYGDSGGGSDVPGGLTRADLERINSYNTYVQAGLPAGPICSPGLAAIHAAAHPARSNALYFVADGLGGHSFSDSLEEHLRNVARFRGLARR
jgi:UPF0755 protein